MSRNSPLLLDPTQQAVPMIAIANPPIPAMDPFEAILATQFLLRNVWLEFFVFTAVWNTLAASASGQQATATIDPSIDFLVLQMNLIAYSSVGTIVQSPDYLLEVQEASGRSSWSDGPVHVGNWTGCNRDAGAQTYTLPCPRYVRGNNAITFKLTNNTATAARVDLSIMGRRVTYNNVSREKLFNIPF